MQPTEDSNQKTGEPHCYYHLDAAAIHQCPRCTKYFCDRCKVIRGKEVICKECSLEMTPKQRAKFIAVLRALLGWVY